MRTSIRRGLLLAGLWAVCAALVQSRPRATFDPVEPVTAVVPEVVQYPRRIGPQPPPVEEEVQRASLGFVEHLEAPALGTPIETPDESFPTDQPSIVLDGTSPYVPLTARVRFWIAPEVLLWQAQGQRVPALVTAAPAGTAGNAAGNLGQPTTAVLFGNGHASDAWRVGMRLSGGFWFDPCQTRGLEASGFYLSKANTNFAAISTGDPGVFRPFFNANGSPNAAFVAFQAPSLNPGTLTPILAGQVTANVTNTIVGGDINYRQLLTANERGRIDFLIGYRRLYSRDSLNVNENLVATDPFPPPTLAPFGTRFLVSDGFTTTNIFNGGQLGLTGEHWRGYWFLNWTTKLALGDTHSTASVTGMTQVLSPLGNAAFPGGLLAQGSNIGRYHTDAFSAVPELDLNVGALVTPRLRVFVGYTVFYWTRLWRAGEQIDVTLSQLPPTPVTAGSHPTFPGNHSDFWLQGASLGAEYRY